MTSNEQNFIDINRALKDKKVVLTSKSTGEQITDTISQVNYNFFADKVTLYLAKNGSHTMLRSTAETFVQTKHLNMCVFIFDLAD